MRMWLAAAGAAVLLASPAAATTILYNDFSSTAGLQLNGAAAGAVDGSGRHVLRVTPSQFSQAGSAFSTNPVTLGATESFSTRFTFDFNAQQNGGADGVVFTVQTNSNNVGGAGGGIGYAGIPNSLGVEFDNWNNGTIDANSDNHVGVDLNGDISSVAFGFPSFQLDSGQDITAWIDYNGAANLLEVRYALGTPRPTLANISYVVNLANVLQSTNAFVGFTSGTGAAAANHDIINWEFRDTFSPINAGVPEPATWGLMLVGFGAMGSVLRRRRASLTA
ncbi:MAG: lectin-like domain-containing protein [Phenylobacterium sp.]